MLNERNITINNIVFNFDKLDHLDAASKVELIALAVVELRAQRWSDAAIQHLLLDWGFEEYMAAVDQRLIEATAIDLQVVD